MRISDKLNKIYRISITNKYLLLFIFVLYFFILTILLLYSFPTHDEILLQLISRRPIVEIFNIVKAEPHPVTYYFLLKIVQFLPLSYQKIIFFTINYFLVYVLIYAINSLKKFEFKRVYSLALVLFLYSTFYLKVSTTLKQDSVSLVILLVIYLICIYSFNNPTKNSLSIWAYFFALAAFFIGYINGLIGFLLVFTSLILKKDYLLFKKLFVLNSMLLFLYFVVFFKEQILINSTRFSWTELFPPSFIFSLNMAFLNQPGISTHSDVYILPLLFFSILGFGYTIERFFINRYISKVHIFNLVTMLFIFICGYFFRLFVRDRYTSFLIFIMFFYASIFFYRVKVYLSRVHILLLISTVIIFNILTYAVISYTASTKNTLKNLESLKLTKNYAYVGTSFGILYVYAVNQYFQLSNIYPIYLNSKNKVDFYKPINQGILRVEGQFSSEDPFELSSLLKEQGVKNIIYTTNILPFKYDDRGSTLFLLLLKSCKNVDLKIFPGQTEFYIFEDCLFI